MKRWLWVVIVLLAASCAAPERPAAWSVERHTPVDEVEELSGICEDVRDLALGSRAEDTGLENTLADLARLAANTGATSALPLLTDVGDLATDTTQSEQEVAILQHDLLLLAGRSIDDSTAAVCGIPAFSALYATTGFPDCHFEMEIPIAAYTEPSSTQRCTSEGRPTYLPCWSDDGNHLAVDCVTGEIVQATDGRWAPAGEPRVVTIDRTVPDAPDGPEIVAPRAAAQCRALAALFVGDSTADAILDQLVDAAEPLSDEVRDSIDHFIAAEADPPTLDEFEAIVLEVDEATATECGLPVVSAWTSLTPPVDALPCWTRTGIAFPAYETIDCE